MRRRRDIFGNGSGRMSGIRNLSPAQLVTRILGILSVILAIDGGKPEPDYGDDGRICSKNLFLWCDRICCNRCDSIPASPFALENQKSILEVVIMGYEMWEIWMAIRRFLIGWAVALGILFVASCIRYHAFIAEAFVSHTGVLINGIMPILLILFGIGYALKTVFR